MTEPRMTAFVSSTAIDLPQHRALVIKACTEKGYFPDGMELWPATDADAMQLCLDKVESADVFIGVYGHRYGWIPPGQALSITELEYDRAVARNIPRLIFVMGDEHPLLARDFETGEGAEALRRFKQRIQTDRVRAAFDSADQLRAEVLHALGELKPIATAAPVQPAITSIGPIAAIASTMSHGIRLFGRDAVLAKLGTQLQGKSVLVLYGMRGIGKTELIKQLARAESRAGGEPHRIRASNHDGADYLFRQLAPMLGDASEQPQRPLGDAQAVANQLCQRYPNAQASCIWIDQAHQWLGSKGWRDAELNKLFVGCKKAFGDRWLWIFELRERPVAPGLFGQDALEEEVRGLDKQSLAACLAACAPEGETEAWTYTGDRLKQLYQWLGGGHGHQAHPQATQLLVEVAKGLNVAPLDVRQRFLEAAEEKVVAFLLRDLFESVLSPSERQLLEALALYRDAIPHDHADPLEQKLNVVGAWAGLDRRCLLASNATQERYYLHGFVAGWLRHRLGYVGDDEDMDAMSQGPALSETQQETLVGLHGHIASCWLDQLAGKTRVTLPNIERALEAFHHLLSAGDGDRIQDIAASLLGPNQEWASQRLWAFDEALRKTGKPVSEQRKVLSFITQLDSLDHKAWRFLGECLQQEGGDASLKALAAFERALALHPGFPQYLANVGKSLRAQGPAGAQAFLERLKIHREQYPEAVNDFVVAIEAQCLQMTPSSADASALRQARINEGSRHPAFYSAEAEYQLGKGDAVEALRLLDLAKQRGCSDDYTDSIRATVLQSAGDGAGASALRQARINEGSHDPVFYHAEAEYQLGKGDAVEALRLLDLAKQRGCSDDYTDSIRATVLQNTGDGAGASALRQARINEGSHDPFFYSAEADYQLGKGDAVEALRLLDLLVKQRGCSDDYTDSIRAKVLRQLQAE